MVSHQQRRGQQEAGAKVQQAAEGGVQQGCRDLAAKGTESPAAAAEGSAQSSDLCPGEWGSVRAAQERKSEGWGQQLGWKEGKQFRSAGVLSRGRRQKCLLDMGCAPLCLLRPSSTLPLHPAPAREQHSSLHACPYPAAIRFVLNDAFTNMRAEERQQLLHVSAFM